MALSGQHTLATLAVKYLNFQMFAKSASEMTLKSYAGDLNQFLDLGQKLKIQRQNDRWEVVSTRDSLKQRLVHRSTGISDKSDNIDKSIQHYLKAIHIRWSHLSTASRNRKYACLKSFFNWMYKEGWIQRDLATQVYCPKVPQKIPHFISMDEAIALLTSLNKSDDPNRKRNLSFILLLYGAGLRVSEACELKWKQIDFSGRTILVKGKGNKERQVAMITLLVKSLGTMVRLGQYVFATEVEDKSMSPRNGYEIVRRAGVNAELLKPLHPHALRHSFATHMLSSGTDLRVLQEILGHDSLTATQKYLHLSIENLSRTMESFHPLGRKKIEKNNA